MSLSEIDERAEAGPTGPARHRIRRVVAVIVVGVLGLAGSAAIWSATSLNGLPVIEGPSEPPPVVIPDDENAFTYFRHATDRFVGHESDIGPGNGVYEDWSHVPPGMVRSLEANRESLSLWFEGTTRNRALYIDPRKSTFETTLNVTQRFRSFSRLAGLQAYKLRIEGDHAGAWSWIRANLRCGLLSGQNGFLVERLVGIAIYGEAAAQALAWADDPEVGTDLVRKAFADVLALESLAPDLTPVVYSMYWSLINSLNDREAMRSFLRLENPGRKPWIASQNDGILTAYEILNREPERSRRIVRLIVANLLSACDLPPEERTPRAVRLGELTLYRAAPGTNPPLSPEEIARWFETSLYARRFFSNWVNIESTKNKDERTRAAMIVSLAERLYRRERGSEPPSPEALVGPYLKSLPAGYLQGIDDLKAKGANR